MKISFIPSSKEVELVVPEPTPAIKCLPEWYKSTKNFDAKNLKIDEGGNLENRVLKQCMPFLDGLTSGYIQELWTDVYVEKNENGVAYHYSCGPNPMGVRNALSIPAPENFYQHELYWRMPWLPKTPKGYSLLFTHPINRTDLPFLVTSGIMDSDKFYHSPFGNLPFLLDKNFSGIIKRGTPMFQFIPIKRESWNSGVEKFNEEEITKRVTETKKSFWGSYKKYFWQKKYYS